MEKLTGSDAQDNFQAFGNSNVKPEFDYNDI
jgi:hypothetical protein